MKAIDISNYLIDLASQSNENDLTNLKLQKLLYFAQGKYMSSNEGKVLFDDELEAWGYGPVVKNVYHTFKGAGSFPLTVFDEGYSPAQIDGKIKAFLDSIWSEIGQKYSAFFLVKKTHAEGTPWKAVFQEGVDNIIIPKESLFEYFSKNEL